LSERVCSKQILNMNAMLQHMDKSTETKYSASPHWGLNPGPSVYKTDALPLSYRGNCI